MEYLNNLLNSNTQSGGVYDVSMHQLNKILQLSSAYFYRFNDKTKQEYIKLFGNNIDPTLAFYEHDHDHKHLPDGSIDHSH